MTNGKLVDTIEGRLGVYRKDDRPRIPRRLILFTALNISQTYHSQRLGERVLKYQDSLYTKVPCVPMEKVDSKACGLELYRCRTIMRSKCKIPESVYGKFGNSVQMVTNVTDTKRIDKTTYEDIIDRQSKGRYSDVVKKIPRWFIFGGYLYVLDWEIQMVNVWLFSLQRDDTCDNIDICETGELICPCTSRWDVTFVASDTALMYIVDRTVEVLGNPRVVQIDENPDNNTNSVT